MTGSKRGGRTNAKQGNRSKALSPAQRGANTRKANRAAETAMLAQLEALAARDERSAARRARTSQAAFTKRVLSQRPQEPPRVAAARKGWITRRENEARRHRHVFKANPDEVAAGDFAYQLYDNAHPLHGDPDTIALWDERLREFYGSWVRVTLNGYRTDPATGGRHRIFIRRLVLAEGYSSVFGPGGVYGKMCKVVRNRGSEDELVTTSLTVELAEDGDDDGEF